MLFLNRITWSLAVAAGLLAAPLSAYRAPQKAVLALRTLDQRVAAVGHRLATFNVAVCGERQWHPGFMIHDLSQYARRSRQQAIARFGLGEGPAILALVPGSPAARAGLRLDDVLVVADGNLLPRPPRNTHDSFAPTERIIDALEVAFSDGAAELTIRRMGKDRAVLVAAELGCATRFQVTPSPLLQAKADGRYVQLTSAFVEYARGDHELAALLAHELAHNILRHRLRLKAAGADWGQQAEHGPSARLFQQTELEADRLAIHLMERAGYDPAAAVRLWTRQSKGEFAILLGGRHPPWASRIAALESEIRVIAEARSKGSEPHMPPFGSDPEPSAH